MFKTYSAAQWRLSKPKVPKTLLITWACRCGITYSVRANDPDLHLLPAKIKCFRGGQPCRFYMTRLPQRTKKVGPTVRGLELYRMTACMGTPDERKCSPTELKKLVGKKLLRMSLEPSSDKDRSFVNSLTFEGGITVHLATSTKGVTVYKVTNE